MAVPAEKKKWIAGLIAGGVLLLAPVLGLLGTVLGLIGSFGAVGAPGIDPAQKSEQLATGISHAMWSTAIGIGLVPIGLIVGGVSLYMMLRTPAAA